MSASKEESYILHRPAKFFTRRRDDEEHGRQCILIVLNQPIEAVSAFHRAWNQATWRIVVDGGADRLLKLERRLDGVSDELDDAVGEVGTRYIPDLIVGDLDSITPFATLHYLRHGVHIARDPDQYSSDVGKALEAARALRSLPDKEGLSRLQHQPRVVPWSELSLQLQAQTQSTATDEALKGKPTDLLLFSTLGGRVDQGLGVLSDLAREYAAARGWQCYLVSERSVSLVLGGPSQGQSKAQHVLHLGGNVFSPNCGILPIFGPATITLRGFEWDVEDWPTEMGGNVSTSQHVLAADGLTRVETTANVLFTIELAGELIQ